MELIGGKRPKLGLRNSREIIPGADSEWAKLSGDYPPPSLV